MPPTTTELVHDQSLGKLLDHCDVELAGLPAPQRAARGALASLLDDTDQNQVDDAALIASELIANAIQHSCGAVLIRIEVYELGTALGVVDRGRDTDVLPPHPCNSSVEPDTVATHGRGLFIIQNLADTWSVEETSNGKIVIAVLARKGSR
ncbi:ATP-binding protein (plasmid) [Streptomyces microflavus]|uniref:ATP-binding protein n=1 Tax=Streptomyces microflavus TaxID=1919 RepID=UPI002E16223F|nr:ATP-binding protein [Streptomyces microflavus]